MAHSRLLQRRGGKASDPFLASFVNPAVTSEGRAENPCKQGKASTLARLPTLYPNVPFPTTFCTTSLAILNRSRFMLC